MKRALFVAILAMTLISLATTAHSVNCMWDNTCENPKYDIDFCGNGQCEPFETKDTCVEDCGSLLDIIAGKIKSYFATKESGGPFGGIADSGVAMILAFFVVIIVLVVLGVILIVVYNKMVGSIEREIIPSGE